MLKFGRFVIDSRVLYYLWFCYGSFSYLHPIDSALDPQGSPFQAVPHVMAEAMNRENDHKKLGQ